MWEEMLADITDSINIKIVNFLMDDGRMSDQLIANKIGISKTAVRNRRLSLQKDGVIRIGAILVLQNINFSYADVFIRFKPDSSREKKAAFIQKCLEDENIYEQTQYIGDFDMILRFLHKNPAELKEHIDSVLHQDIISERLILPATRSNKAWGVKLPSKDYKKS